MKLHDEEQIDDPRKPSQFGGKSREEWMLEQIENLAPRVLEQERERIKERLFTWPLIVAVSAVGLLSIGLVVFLFVDRMGELLREFLIGVFGSPEMAFLGVVGFALAVVGFRALTANMARQYPPDSN
jgi:hypothetical protein